MLRGAGTGRTPRNATLLAALDLHRFSHFLLDRSSLLSQLINIFSL